MKALIYSLFALSLSANASTSINFSNYVFPKFEVEITESSRPFYINRTLTVSQGSIIKESFLESEEDVEGSTEEFQDTIDFCELVMTYASQNGFPIGKVSFPVASYPMKMNFTNQSWGVSSLKPLDPDNIITSYINGELTESPDDETLGNESTYKSSTSNELKPYEVYFSRLTCVTHGKQKNYTDHEAQKVIQNAFGSSLIVKKG